MSAGRPIEWTTEKINNLKSNPNNEIFKDVFMYEGLYQVSNYGRVKSLKRNKWNGSGFQTIPEKILKPRPNGKGYFQVFLSRNGKAKAIKIHQLVAIAFLNHKPDKTMKVVINHINFDKLDNRSINLELITQRENTSRTHIKSTSKYTGVSWEKSRNKWRARMYVNGKNLSLGMFENEIDAHLAYQNKLNSL